MKNPLLRLLWLVGLPFILIPVFPLLPLAMIGSLIWWMFTGEFDVFLFGRHSLWNYPPLRWVDRYLSIYGSK